ncbi:hypothetical protein LUZ60_014691 [Juncus effusus]|nr:hypothetical protein LUZ60_014691 [Juncus effusus]
MEVHFESTKIKKVNTDGNNQSVYLDLYGDVLESVLTEVPSIDLIRASCVSHEWRRAVRSSLHHHPRRLPSLILRHLSRPNSPSFSIHAFDPNSRTWLTLPQHRTSDRQSEGMTKNFLHGPNGDRLYGLSLSKLVVSDDTFGVTCPIEMKGPKIWRQDPVVADVGQWVILVGGGCAMVDEEEVGAVEIYDKHTKIWQSAMSMPVQFNGSTSAMWLSTTVSSKKLYVMEKKTCWISQFDPASQKWGHTCQLRPDSTVSSWCITTGRNNKLVLVGVRNREEERKTTMMVNFWEVDRETLCMVDKEFDEMPREIAERLFPCNESDDYIWHSQSIEVRGTEHGGYVYNPSDVRNGAVMYELSEEREMKKGRRIVKRWEWVPLSETLGDGLMGCVAFGCSKVGLGELVVLGVN